MVEQFGEVDEAGKIAIDVFVDLDELQRARADFKEIVGDIDALAGKGGFADRLQSPFELGASSLKLIEIHETIDRDFPGLIDLTELFDHPTIAQLAKHLQAKIAGAPA